MTDAIVSLSYKGARENEMAAVVTIVAVEEETLRVEVGVDTGIRPAHIIFCLALALHAAVGHYAAEGIHSTFTGVQDNLMMRIQETVNLIELEETLEQIAEAHPEPAPYDGWDEIKLCESCGAYTTGRLCVPCAQQESIDRDC